MGYITAHNTTTADKKRLLETIASEIGVKLKVETPVKERTENRGIGVGQHLVSRCLGATSTLEALPNRSPVLLNEAIVADA